MDEKRQFNRLYSNESKKIYVRCEGGKEEDVPMLDLSANGMRLKFTRPIDIGSTLRARIHLLSSSNIYFVRGKILRVEEKNGAYETSVQFDKIDTSPIED